MNKEKFLRMDRLNDEQVSMHSLTKMGPTPIAYWYLLGIE
jgi:hypothetical protein